MGEASRIQIDLALPILLPAAYGLLMLLFAPASRRDARWLGVFGVIGMSACALMPAAILWIRSRAELPILTGGSVAERVVSIDRPSLHIASLIGLVGVAALALEVKEAGRRRWSGEIYSLHFFVVTGLMMAIHTENLFMLFVGIEVVFLASLVLGAVLKRDTPGLRSSLEYFVIGNVGAGFSALGTALVFSVTGAFSYASLTGEAVREEAASARLGPEALLAGLALILAGLAIQGAIPPFHGWRARTLETATSPLVVVRLVAVPVAVAAVVSRLSLAIRQGASGLIDHWLSTLSILSLVAMAYGIVSLLRQRTLRGMVEPTVLVQMGFFLATALLSPTEREDLLFLQMLLASGGTIALIVLFDSLEGRSASPKRPMRSWQGLWSRHRGAAIVLTLLLLSLGGWMPAGLWLKRGIVIEALGQERRILATCLVLAGVLLALHYASVLISVFARSRPARISSDVKVSGSRSGHLGEGVQSPTLSRTGTIVLVAISILLIFVDLVEGIARWQAG